MFQDKCLKLGPVCPLIPGHFDSMESQNSFSRRAPSWFGVAADAMSSTWTEAIFDATHLPFRKTLLKKRPLSYEQALYPMELRWRSSSLYHNQADSTKPYIALLTRRIMVPHGRTIVLYSGMASTMRLVVYLSATM